MQSERFAPTANPSPLALTSGWNGQSVIKAARKRSTSWRPRVKKMKGDCMRTQSTSSVLQIFENVNDMVKSFDSKSAYRILRKNFKLLEEESLKFHETMKNIIEQIAFHRESLQGRGQTIFAPRIKNFLKCMDEFNQEYKKMLRDPKAGRTL